MEHGTCSLFLQLTKREIAHQGLQVEANATALVLRLVQLPPSPGVDTQSASWLALLKRLLSVSIRVQGKATKSWMAEFVFYGSPLASTHPKEQGKLMSFYVVRICYMIQSNFKSTVGP
jgi:mediator of RNA polymerase II transcription subunit 14